jgi:putative CRISPR-associated protein (TIGR02619 family)
MATIITTTGISLYLNTRKEYKTESPTDDEMRQYLRRQPAAASAEANSLLQLTQPVDALVFLCTETSESQRCAKLLKEFFLKRGHQQVRIEPLQFQDDEKHIETHGLRNLVNALIAEIEAAQRKNQEIVINATPGFKLESGYSTIIGMLYQVPVKYIHEKFKRVVTLNPIALDWDTNLFFNYSWFFKWVDQEPRTQQDVEQHLKGILELDKEQILTMLTKPDENNFVYLSPMGDVLFRKFRRETEEAALMDWPVPAEIDGVDEKIAESLVKSKHHPITNLLLSCRKIAELPFVRQVLGGNYENTTLSRVKRYDAYGVIYVLWADDKKAQNLIVQTTAQGKPQTLKVANKIKEILNI